MWALGYMHPWSSRDDHALLPSVARLSHDNSRSGRHRSHQHGHIAQVALHGAFDAGLGLSMKEMMDPCDSYQTGVVVAAPDAQGVG